MFWTIQSYTCERVSLFSGLDKIAWIGKISWRQEKLLFDFGCGLYLSDQIRIGKVAPGISSWRAFLGDVIGPRRAVHHHVLWAEAVNPMRSGRTVMERGASGPGEGAAGIMIILGHCVTKLRPPVTSGPVLEDALGSLLVLELIWPQRPLPVLGRGRGAVGRQELPVPGRLDVGGLGPAGLHVHADLLLEILQPEREREVLAGVRIFIVSLISRCLSNDNYLSRWVWCGSPPCPLICSIGSS